MIAYIIDTVFMYRFHPRDITMLEEFTTQMLFMLQALRLVTASQLRFDKDTILTLAALALQACDVCVMHVYMPSVPRIGVTQHVMYVRKLLCELKKRRNCENDDVIYTAK